MLEALRTLLSTSSTQERASDPGDPLLFPYLDPSSSSSSSALSLPAFWRAVRIRTDLLSTFGMHAELDGEVLDELPPLLEQPDPSEDRATTVASMEASLILRGEVIAVLGDFELGFPNVLKVVDPSKVQIQSSSSSSSSSSRTYIIGGRPYDRSEVLHVVPFKLPGETRGVGVLDLHRRVIDGEITAQEFQRTFYADGASPSIVIKVDRDWSPTELAEYKQAWMSKLRGRREPIVLPADITADAFELSNSDSQYVEGRELGLLDIANMVGIPAHYLGWSGSSRTYSNTQDERRSLLDIYLRGSIYTIERALSSLLPVEAKMSTETFLRLDRKAQVDVMRVEGGWTTVDELRAKDKRPPLEDGRGSMLAIDANTQQAPDPTPQVEQPVPPSNAS